jgi:hypothetical protein
MRCLLLLHVSTITSVLTGNLSLKRTMFSLQFSEYIFYQHSVNYNSNAVTYGCLGLKCDHLRTYHILLGLRFGQQWL